jgi:X box-binding protein 1
MLRAGIAIPPVVTPTPADLERESARERENQELRERIKTLEKGWDAVLKALTAQGLPTTLSTTTTPTTPTVLPQVADKPAPPVVPDSIPALSPSMFPLSPAPTQASLDFDIDLSLPTALSPEQSSASSEPQQPTEPTRHLARVATTKASLPLVSLQRVDSKRSAPSKAFKLVQSMNQQWTPCSARSSARRRLPRSTTSKRSTIFLLMTRSSRVRPPFPR